MFRWSVRKTVLPTLIFGVLAAAAAWQLVAPLEAVAKVPIFVRVVSTLGFFLFAWVAWAQTKAGVGPRGLVVVLDSQYLWVKYRSPLNHHVGDPDDTQVVGIPISQIVWASPTTVKTLRPTANHGKTGRTVDCLDLGVSEKLDLEPLRERLAEEKDRRRKAGHSHQHFPIRITEAHTLRLDLYNVGGGSEKLIQALPPQIERRASQFELIEQKAALQLGEDTPPDEVNR